MRPLLFVNWARLASRFTALMWAVALILACVVIAHLPGSPGTGGHATGSPPPRLVSPR